MAFPNITLAYSSFAKGISPTALVALMGNVPAPEEILEEYGCYLTADATANVAGKVTRTLTVTAVSSATATATVVRQGGQSGAPLDHVHVTAPGAGYVRPPIGILTDPSTESLPTFLGSTGKGGHLQAYLKLVGQNATIIKAGNGYSNQTVAGLVGGLPLGTNTIIQARPGFGAVDPLLFTGTTRCGTRTKDPPAYQQLNTLGCVRAVSVKTPGIGYNPATTKIVWVGAVPIAGGRMPTAFPEFDGMGRCLDVVMVDMGCGYVTTPIPMLVDTTAPGGRGCVLRSNMVRGVPGTLGVTVNEDTGAIIGLPITSDGDGYVTMPTVVIFDPTGMGGGAVATVGPIPGTPSLFGVSRVDVLARGSGYVAPALGLLDVFAAGALPAANLGLLNTVMLGSFGNLMKTALEQRVGTVVTQTIS